LKAVMGDKMTISYNMLATTNLDKSSGL